MKQVASPGSMPFSQIIPPSPSPTESKRLFYTSVSLSKCALFHSSVQLLSRVPLFATSRTAACQASLSFIISQNLLKLMFIESVMPSKHLILCCLLLLPSIFSSIRASSNELALHIRWPKYWRFSFSCSNKYSGLISFRIDWFDILVVQDSQESSPTL